MSTLVSPSILAANPLQLGEEILATEAARADWHHVDVMDGHFVPNLTFGLPLVRALKKKSQLPLDVHIMVTNPDEVALDYVDAGADILSFHWEATVHHHRLAAAINERGAKVGIALNPSTPITSVIAMLPFIDLVTLMSVNPGFGGQTFIPETIARLRELKGLIKACKSDVLIEVDGGVCATNASELRQAGADVLVAGSYVYGHADRFAAIQSLRGDIQV